MPSPPPQAQPGKWQVPAECSHDKEPGQLAVDLVREKLFRRLHQELPYRLAPVLGAPPPHVTADGRLRISVDVAVASAVQRSIVVGAAGCIITDYVQARTERELTSVLGREVSLSVRVLVRAPGHQRHKGQQAGGASG